MISPRRVSLTEGSPYRLIFSMALPMVFGIPGMLAYGWMMGTLRRDEVSAHGE